MSTEPLAKRDLRKIITAAGTGPHAVRDRALVALLAYTGVSVVDAVQFHAAHLSGGRGVWRIINPGWLFEFENRRVGLEPGARRILDEAIALVGRAKLFPGVSIRKAKRIVARSFLAAGLAPQRSAARLREAFFQLATKAALEQRNLMSAEDLNLPRSGAAGKEPKNPARRKSRAKSKGPRRRGRERTQESGAEEEPGQVERAA